MDSIKLLMNFVKLQSAWKNSLDVFIIKISFIEFQFLLARVTRYWQFGVTICLLKSVS